MPHFYRVFGLSVESVMPCPELLPAESTPHADIQIRYDEVPAVLEAAVESGPRWQAAPGRYLLNAGGLARYCVRDGREIIVHPSHTITEDALRAVLLGTGLSILLHQRGLLPLHCGAIETDRGAVVFAGRSGSGKSTLVAAFLQRGFKILADDMLALELIAGGEVTAWPGFPHVRLWADSAQALGRSTQELRRVSPDMEKFLSPELGSFCSTPCGLHAIYSLRVGDDPAPRLEPLGHTARFNVLLNTTWQRSILSGLGVRERHFQMTADIASRTYGACLVRPSQPLQIWQAVDLIQADIEQKHRPD
jgi:hypothetical protein